MQAEDEAPPLGPAEPVTLKQSPHPVEDSNQPAIKWSTSPAAPLYTRKYPYGTVVEAFSEELVASSRSPNVECGTCSFLDTGGQRAPEGRGGGGGLREERAEGKGQGEGLGVEFTTTPAWVLEP